MPLRLPSVVPRLSVNLEALAGLKRDVTRHPGEAEPRCGAYRILLFEYHTSEYIVQDHLLNEIDKVRVRGRRALIKRLFLDNLYLGLFV
jgi:hypothetical protein